jgi:hypothetical protein
MGWWMEHAAQLPSKGIELPAATKKAAPETST